MNSTGIDDQHFTVRKAAWSHDQETIRSIRERVFVNEQKVPPELEWDGRDHKAVHVLAFNALGDPIGTARMLTDGHIGRMAVLSANRRCGVGSAMLRLLLELAAQREFHTLFLNAQTHALEFYRKHGFVEQGQAFLDAGIPHKRMVFQAAAFVSEGQ